MVQFVLQTTGFDLIHATVFIGYLLAVLSVAGNIAFVVMLFVASDRNERLARFNRALAGDLREIYEAWKEQKASARESGRRAACAQRMLSALLREQLTYLGEE